MLISIPTCVFPNHVTLGTSLKMGTVTPPCMSPVKVHMIIRVKHQHIQWQNEVPHQVPC